jgi:hypothetical protein
VREKDIINVSSDSVNGRVEKVGCLKENIFLGTLLKSKQKTSFSLTSKKWKITMNILNS